MGVLRDFDTLLPREPSSASLKSVPPKTVPITNKKIQYLITNTPVLLQPIYFPVPVAIRTRRRFRTNIDLERKEITPSNREILACRELVILDEN